MTESIINFIRYFQLPIKGKKVADSSKQSSRRVSSVVGDYWNPWWTNNQLFHNMHNEIALQEEKIEIELEWIDRRKFNQIPDHVTNVHHFVKFSVGLFSSLFNIWSQGNLKPFFSLISCNQRPNSMRHVPTGTPSSTWVCRSEHKLKNQLKKNP